MACAKHIRAYLDDDAWQLRRRSIAFAARKQIVARLEEQGLVEKIEPHTHVVPHGDRSNVVIEPFLTDQWYVNAKKLAQPAIAAVREGKTKFVPKNWENTYFNWMENIQPWCISRQLWWGHQIPAWYGPDGSKDVRCRNLRSDARKAGASANSSTSKTKITAKDSTVTVDDVANSGGRTALR